MINDDLTDEFVTECKKREAETPFVEIHVPFGIFMAILGHLQLALRHPGSTGIVADAITQFVRQSQDTFSQDSAIWRGIERGWHSAFDVTENDDV